jgi:hypothetical protein
MKCMMEEADPTFENGNDALQNEGKISNEKSYQEFKSKGESKLSEKVSLKMKKDANSVMEKPLLVVSPGEAPVPLLHVIKGLLLEAEI